MNEQSKSPEIEHYQCVLNMACECIREFKRITTNVTQPLGFKANTALTWAEMLIVNETIPPEVAAVVEATTEIIEACAEGI